jgi:hypothetical protein
MEKEVKEGTVDQELINFLSDFEPKDEDIPEPPLKEDEPKPVDKDEPKPKDVPGDEPSPKPKQDEPGPKEDEDEDEDEVKTLREQNELLLKRLNLLEKVPVPKDDEPKPPVDKKPADKKDIDFLSGMSTQDYDALFEDPKKFNALLLKVYEKGLEHKTSDVSENVLKNIPKLVVEYQKRNNATQELVNQFYKDNPDLVKVSKTVAAVTNEVAAEMPDKSLKDCFDEVAKRTRSILGLKATAKKDPIPPAGDPNLPDKTKQKKGTNSRTTDLKGVAKEINDLINM